MDGLDVQISDKDLGCEKNVRKIKYYTREKLRGKGNAEGTIIC